jgi:1,4-dihydroxy-2-naphthoyl-CoA hydrolase
MSFAYPRKIRFQDTDAAGVMYFSHMLDICHEAYEESLEASNIRLQDFCQGRVLALPITHAEVDFHRPLVSGDMVTVILLPHQLKSTEFEISYQVLLSQNNPESPSPPLVAQAKTRHVCIHPITRKRQDLPTLVIEWLRRWSFGT